MWRPLGRKPDARGRGGRLTGTNLQSVSLPAELLQAIIDAARAALPNECVGLLVGPAHADDGGHPTRYIGLDNAARSPFRYELDPDQQARLMPELEDGGEVVWAIVHSHVASPAVPSSADVGQAFYPGSLHLICSLADPVPVVRAWRIRDGEVIEVTLGVA